MADVIPLVNTLVVPPIIYVGSPLRPQEGDPGWDGTDKGAALAFEANVEFAEMISREVALAGGVPYAPHLLFPRFFNDAVPEERELALIMGRRMISVCDEAWFHLPPWRMKLSSGMEGERQTAETLDVPSRVCRDQTAFEIQLHRLRAREVKIRLRTLVTLPAVGA